MGFIGMEMWNWRQYRDGMFQNTYVPYLNVLGMYLRLIQVVALLEFLIFFTRNFGKKRPILGVKKTS